MMVIGPIIALIGGGCLGFTISCLMVANGHGDERERELRHKMVHDVNLIREEYDSQYPDSTRLIDEICDDVEHIIRMEQV